jgi:hypothetical protein
LTRSLAKNEATVVFRVQNIKPRRDEDD